MNYNCKFFSSWRWQPIISAFSFAVVGMQFLGETERVHIRIEYFMYYSCQQNSKIISGYHVEILAEVFYTGIQIFQNFRKRRFVVCLE